MSVTPGMNGFICTYSTAQAIIKSYVFLNGIQYKYRLLIKSQEEHTWIYNDDTALVIDFDDYRFLCICKVNSD